MASKDDWSFTVFLRRSILANAQQRRKGHEDENILCKLQGVYSCLPADKVQVLADLIAKDVGHSSFHLVPNSTRDLDPDIIPLAAVLKDSGLQNDDSITVVTFWDSKLRLYCTLHAFTGKMPDGSVRTWGDDGHGGDSSHVDLNDTQYVCATDGAFAAVKSNGSVVTWGKEFDGGDSRPVQDSLKGIKRIYCSNTAFAAVSNDAIVTWGGSRDGGINMVLPLGEDDVQCIYSSSRAFAALKMAGSVQTWGQAAFGGDSKSVREHLLGNIRTIYSTDGAFAALKMCGAVVSWGDQNGACNKSVWSQLSDVQRIYSTASAFAALKTGGAVVTWGDGPTGGQSPWDQLLKNVKAVFSTNAAFAALKDDGSVVTWGKEEFGGNSRNVQEQLHDIDIIYCTDCAFAALRSDATVVTWGNARYGGDSTLVQDELQVIGPIHSMYSTSGAFALLSASGAVVTWGSKVYGGNSEAVKYKLSERVLTIHPSRGAFAAIRCGGDSSFADDSVVTWGPGRHGGYSPWSETVVDEDNVDEDGRRHSVNSQRQSFMAVNPGASSDSVGTPRHNSEKSDRSSRMSNLAQSSSLQVQAAMSKASRTCVMS